MHIHRQWLLDELGKQPFKSLLDIGCGKGLNLGFFREAFPDATYMGIDIVSSDIEEGNRLKPGGGLISMDVQNLSILSDQSIDVITSDGVMMYVKDREKAAREMMRVGKTIILCEHHSSDPAVLSIPGNFLMADYTKLFPGIQFIRQTKEWGDPIWDDYGWVMRWSS